MNEWPLGVRTKRPGQALNMRLLHENCVKQGPPGASPYGFADQNEIGKPAPLLVIQKMSGKVSFTIVGRIAILAE